MKLARIVCVLMAFSALKVSAAKAAPDVVVEMTAALADFAATQRAKGCFQKIKFMLVGFDSKAKGIGIETYVARGLSTPGTETYALLERGYTLSGVLDPQVNQYFDTCVDQPE